MANTVNTVQILSSIVESLPRGTVVTDELLTNIVLERYSGDPAIIRAFVRHTVKDQIRRGQKAVRAALTKRSLPETVAASSATPASSHVKFGLAAVSAIGERSIFDFWMVGNIPLGDTTATQLRLAAEHANNSAVGVLARASFYNALADRIGDKSVREAVSADEVNALLATHRLNASVDVGV
jgi:hypothetical protein